MNFDLERLYSLLPAIYRIRDTEHGKPLKALMSVLVEQLNVLEEDLAQLYDDQFIETCADWVVPYIGDLIGYHPLYGVTPQIASPRAEVANTITYRRRKGTAAMLEQLAHDVTGWNARVVEFFQLLATTQYMNHLRPENLAMASLRNVTQLERINTPFDQLSHTADVRRIASNRGRYNIPNIGIFLWRLKPYTVTESQARQVDVGRYTFHPLGFDVPLFNLPRPEASVTELAQPINVPEPLRRRALYADTEAQRQALANNVANENARKIGSYLADPQPVVRIFAGNGEITSDKITICDLSVWRHPAAQQNYTPQPTAQDPQPAPVPLPIEVALDPVLGRLAFPQNVDPGRVDVSYTYGFSDDLGGGPYERGDPAGVWTPLDSRSNTLDQDLQTAVAANNQIVLTNSAIVGGNLQLPAAANATLTLRAKNGARPVIDGTLTVVAAPNATVVIDGLWITQGLVVSGIEPITLVVRHCTLVPLSAGPSLSWNTANSSGESRGTLQLDHTISGQIIAGEGVGVEIYDSIVDAQDRATIALAAGENVPPGAQGPLQAGIATIVRSTVIGRVSVREVDLVENSIITDLLISARQQHGCVRFSYLAPGSQTPRQFFCQPALASQQTMTAKQKLHPKLSAAEETAIQSDVQARIRPSFTALSYGLPGYAQLHTACPTEIRAGAEDGAEMGAFHDLYQPQRETNLRVRLEEYLRFGLEAGIFYTT